MKIYELDSIFGCRQASDVCKGLKFNVSFSTCFAKIRSH